MSELTEIVKARVDQATKEALRAEMRRSERTEAAIVRLALRYYLGQGADDQARAAVAG